MKRRYEKAIVLMTAMVPTVGHINMLQFANKIADKVHLIVSYRSNEPMVKKRKNFWRNHCNMVWTLSHEHDDDAAPQNPNPDLEYDAEFWNYWRNVILDKVNDGTDFYNADSVCIVASEPYGADVAKSLGVHFMPYDMYREYNPCKGTDVRSNLYLNWNDVAPSFRSFLKQTFVMFGQESVGKSTMSKALQERGSFPWIYKRVPEYARGYLENTSIELNVRSMRDILDGQWAIERIAESDYSHMVTIMDTDIRSTEGYYRHLNIPWIEQHEFSQYTKDRFYFVLPDDIPFEEDKIRYGGDVRETDMKFWTDILDERGVQYVVVPEGTLASKVTFMSNVINDVMNKKFKELENFKRV